MIVVTGATGHIGNVLVRELASRNESIRTIILPGEDVSPLDGLTVEMLVGDIRDKEFLLRAFDGAHTVYHLAGFISIVSGNKELLHSINVEGTRNVVEACLQTGVKRLVYTSSIHAFQEPPHGITIDETFPYDPKNVLGDYAKSKAMATIEVLKGIKRGLNAVIVCPTGVIGPYDFKNSEMGKLIRDYMSNKLKMYIDGAYDFVDVRDVARGLVLACDKGECGESYILSGQRISIYDLLQVLQKTTGIKAPIYKAPVRLVRALGGIFTPFYRLFKTKPLFTTYSIDVLRSNSFVCSEKAARKLGYSKRSVVESITDSVAWLRARKKSQSAP